LLKDVDKVKTFFNSLKMFKIVILCLYYFSSSAGALGKKCNSSTNYKL
jgi:hypothetical protein